MHKFKLQNNRNKKLKNEFKKWHANFRDKFDLLELKKQVIDQINYCKKNNLVTIYVVKFNGVGTWIETVNASYMSIKYHLNAIQDSSYLEPSAWFNNCLYIKTVKN